MPPEEAAAWREDLHFMASAMERTHKNLYHSISRDEFAAMVSALDTKIPGLERHEVIVGMARIVAAVGDGHTNIYPTRDPKIGFRALPVAFTFFDGQLYVRAAHESQRQLVGSRVVRIGDRGVDEAYAAAKAIVGRDNEQGARYWAPYLLAMPEVLHALRLTSSLDDVPITVATSSGETTVTLHPIGPVEIMSGDIATTFARREGWIDSRDAATSPEPLWLRRGSEAFHLEHAGKLLYLQVNTVGNTKAESLEQFARRVRSEIAATNPEKVAIDLRLNRGGDGTLLVPFIRALIQSQSVDCKGRLFAIIGPATFSAAQMFVDDLEKYTNVTFVGEPTGSKGNAYGDSRKIVLPRSGVTVRASIYYWQGWHPRDERDATMPQIVAPMTFDAYRDNRDPALEAITAAPGPPCTP
jgi:hypothetical protein